MGVRVPLLALRRIGLPRHAIAKAQALRSTEPLNWRLARRIRSRRSTRIAAVTFRIKGNVATLKISVRYLALLLVAAGGFWSCALPDTASVPAASADSGAPFIDGPPIQMPGP